VDAVEQHFGVFVEDVLRAVAVVHVPIDDKQAGKLVSIAGALSGQSYVAKQAKAHAARRRRMMSGRPHQAQRSLFRTFDNCIDGSRASPGRGQRHLERIRTDDGIGVQHAAAVFGQLLGAVNHLRVVDLGDGLLRKGR